MNIRRVIVDVDVGTDDWMALMYLIYAETRQEVKIEGIICTNGNTTLENVVVNLVRLLEIMKRTDIPVYRGATHELIRKADRLRYHGEDGFADLNLDHIPDTSIVSDKSGAVAIHDIVTTYPNDVSLICIGPLTNLALAIKLFDDLPSKIKDLWIMGGNYTGVGNVSCSAEFNFHFDPEAAYIVLENIVFPTYILPWEACLLPKIPMEWRLEVLGSSKPELSLLTKAEEIIYRIHDTEYWIPCDVFVVFCFLDPKKHILKSSKHHASVELHGGLTRGQVVLDHLKINKPNVSMIEEIDTKLFINEMLKLTN